MPALQLNRLQALQFVLIMFALPAQYLLYEWSGKSEHVRVASIQNLITESQSFAKNYFNLVSWQEWIHQTVQNILKKSITIKVVKNSKKQSNSQRKSHEAPQNNEINRESLAAEVFKYRSTDGFFASSIEPRIRKSSKVKYRVGQVIRHKRFGYKGVIIGWDNTCRAPAFWINQNHGNNKHWKTQPNYAILVDTRDRSSQVTYVVEENIEIITNTPVKHPELNDYFDFYDGAQYHMRPSLRIIYPND